MRLCFVGYGSIAHAHARAFRQLPGVDLSWVVGRDPAATEAFAGEWGFDRWTLNLAEALGSETDGVVITSPSDLHADQAVQSLQAGKHVLVEIPISTRLDDAERVAGLARDSGLRVQVAHTQRYYPALMELRRRICSGELTPHHLVCRWYFLRRRNVNWTGRQRTWTDNLLWHHGCHVVDAVLWLLDAPATNVSGQFGLPHADLGIPLDLDVQFECGVVPVSISMSYNSPWPRHEYFLIGEEACVEYRDGGLFGPDGENCPAKGQDESILRQDLEWLNAVREQRDPEVSPDRVLPAMRVLHAAERNAKRS